MIRVGVIGYGYWGPNLARNFSEASGSRLVAVSDLSQGRLALAARRHPGIRTTTSHQELLADPGIDAVAVATPVSTHFELTRSGLLAGKHVLVEKPLAANSAEAATLVEEAERRKLVLMVDHTFVFTAAVQKIGALVRAGELGELYYYDSARVNLGLFQHDVNVLWDLAVHDLAIMDFVLPHRPTLVSATGLSHVAGGPENIAYLTLYFTDAFIAHIHANWLAPVKLRRTILGGSRRMIVYDDLEPIEKIRVYDKGIMLSSSEESRYRMRVDYRTGDMWAPYLDTTEALRTGVLHFLSCVEAGRRPVTDGMVGWRVVRILEAAARSLGEHGKPIPLDPIEGRP